MEDTVRIEVFCATVDHILQCGFYFTLIKLLVVDDYGNRFAHVNKMIVQINAQLTTLSNGVGTTELHFNTPMFVFFYGGVFNVLNVKFNDIIADIHLVVGSVG